MNLVVVYPDSPPPPPWCEAFDTSFIVFCWLLWKKKTWQNLHETCILVENKSNLWSAVTHCSLFCLPGLGKLLGAVAVDWLWISYQENKNKIVFWWKGQIGQGCGFESSFYKKPLMGFMGDFYSLSSQTQLRTCRNDAVLWPGGSWMWFSRCANSRHEFRAYMCRAISVCKISIRVKIIVTNAFDILSWPCVQERPLNQGLPNWSGLWISPLHGKLWPNQLLEFI